jgi:uncharacterized protein (DUF1800 family)
MASLTYAEAAHLLRRMGFGGPPEEINDLVTRGREGAVDYLLGYDRIDDRGLDDLLQSSFDFSNPNEFTKFNRFELERWWLTRMVHTRRQFQEKMTLFWHNHFATAASKVFDILMYVQNLTLRASAINRFDDLLLKVAQDPAMLFWLDGITNVRGKPNENFARELQELFTLGINDVVTGEPNYSEQDVKEIARTYTGWKFFLPRDNPNPYDYRFFINPPEHDNGPKTIYGQTANYSGEDIVMILSAKRSTARFLVKKLFDFFVYPLTSSASDQATIEKFAGVYLAQNHSIKELVRAVFTSDEFFSDRARFALVKSPVELIVGTIRMLGVRHVSGTYRTGENILTAVSVFLGQELFNPPSVAGWNLNLGWINTSTMLNRFTFADLVAINRGNPQNSPGIYLDHAVLKRQTKATAKKTVKNFLSLLGPLAVDPKTVKSLTAYLQSDDRGNPAGFTPDDAAIDKKVRGLVHLIMCLAEYQMN